MTDAPPLKRKRVDSDPEPPEDEGLWQLRPNYDRSDLWLEDGNVIFVAENTAFRVHRSILSKYSEVFRDMFSIPQPADAEMLEGCPVVHLQDTKNDVAHVLSALFDTGNSYVQIPSLPLCGFLEHLLW